MTEVEETLFGEQIADSVESFLLALREIAREGNGAQAVSLLLLEIRDRKSTRLNTSHIPLSRMPSSA